MKARIIWTMSAQISYMWQSTSVGTHDVCNTNGRRIQWKPNRLTIIAPKEHMSKTSRHQNSRQAEKRISSPKMPTSEVIPACFLGSEVKILDVLTFQSVWCIFSLESQPAQYLTNFYPVANNIWQKFVCILLLATGYKSTDSWIGWNRIEVDPFLTLFANPRRIRVDRPTSIRPRQLLTRQRWFARLGSRAGVRIPVPLFLPKMKEG